MKLLFFCLVALFLLIVESQTFLFAQPIKTNLPVSSLTNALVATSRKPAISLEEALAKAKKYLQQNKIHTDGLSLVMMSYSKYPDGKNSGWMLIWAHDNPYVMDGELRVYVNDDKTIAIGGSS